MDEHDNETGMERLRRAVRILNNCNESFNDRYSAADLLKIVDAHLLGEWDVYPDTWSNRQIREAIEYARPARFREDHDGRLVPVFDTTYSVETEERDYEAWACRIYRGDDLLAETPVGAEHATPGAAVAEARKAAKTMIPHRHKESCYRVMGGTTLCCGRPGHGRPSHE